MGILNENEVICSRGSSANPWNLAQERIEELDPRQGKSGSTPSPSHFATISDFDVMASEVTEKSKQKCQEIFHGNEVHKEIKSKK